MSIRKEEEVGQKVVAGESDSWREKARQRQRGWGRQCTWFGWRHRETYAPEVCICVCFKARQSVTPHISISLRDSPPDQHTWTNTLSFSIPGLPIRLQQVESCKLFLPKLFNHVYMPDKLKPPRKHLWRKNGDNNSEKVREGKKDREWAEEKIWALKYHELLCGYIKHISLSFILWLCGC